MLHHNNKQIGRSKSPNVHQYIPTTKIIVSNDASSVFGKFSDSHMKNRIISHPVMIKAVSNQTLPKESSGNMHQMVEISLTAGG